MNIIEIPIPGLSEKEALSSIAISLKRIADTMPDGERLLLVLERQAFATEALVEVLRNK